jgi:hypothetical protein
MSLRPNIPERDSRKPDPDEPWRYVCPDCGCQVSGQARAMNIRCRGCEWTGEAADTWDKKHDRRAWHLSD